MKKVTVIVACYNCEAYIDDCMNSLLRQTIGFDQLEIILVNDASLDRTIFKLAEYEHRYPDNIILIPLTENQKQGGARNIALPYASGEYVLFLDSDDWLVDCALERLYDTAEQSGADIVQCLGNRADNREKKEWVLRDEKSDELYELSTIEAHKQFIVGDKPILGCCFKLYRNSFLQKNEFRFASGVAFEEPPFVYPMMLMARKIYYLMEHLYVIYPNPQGTMRALCTAEDRKEDHLNASLQVLKEVQLHNLLETYYAEIEFYFIHAYFAESLLILKSRGFFIDRELLQKMQNTVKEQFPDYKNNIYLQDPGWQTTRELAQYIEMQIDETNISEINDKIFEKMKKMLEQGEL